MVALMIPLIIVKLAIERLTGVRLTQPVRDKDRPT